MRILSVHNRYQIRGGEDECSEAEEHEQFNQLWSHWSPLPPW